MNVYVCGEGGGEQGREGWEGATLIPLQIFRVVLILQRRLNIECRSFQPQRSQSVIM